MNEHYFPFQEILLSSSQISIFRTKKHVETREDGLSNVK